MGSRSTAALVGAGLIGVGVAGSVAWRHGFWGLLTGAALTAVWLLALQWRLVVRPPTPKQPSSTTDEASDATVVRVLLDSAPTPLLGVERGAVRALNRAARTIFATDERVLPAPSALTDSTATHLRHDGRTWRISRVQMGDARAGRTVVAMVDVEQEERAAEARATTELMEVLGHELLNGLAPIVSLAESGLSAVAMTDGDPALLREILSTLARRAEGLQRFTGAYRALARLPVPTLRSLPVSNLVDDLARLFVGRWPRVKFTAHVQENLYWPLDRDQMSQAIWAVLQNGAEAAVACRGDASHITLSATEEKAALIVSISDNGEGVPASRAASIFRPFHTTKPDGTGIGLSLARQIAHAHGGELRLQPVMPTTFCFVLPTRSESGGHTPFG